MRVYIIGDINTITRAETFKKFKETEQVLNDKGFVPLNPLKLYEIFPLGASDEYTEIALTMLKNCDGFCVIDCNTKKSRIEKMWAESLHLKEITLKRSN